MQEERFAHFNGTPNTTHKVKPMSPNPSALPAIPQPHPLATAFCGMCKTWFKDDGAINAHRTGQYECADLTKVAYLTFNEAGYFQLKAK
jgi:hypothetical protein